MKLFYVMVLVLVAGAVPSHGRTESEGTVFNMTQPHESMNNVTVNSSKTLEIYNDMYLAMQWPTSYCNSKFGPCFSPPAQFYFTVHGLWPQYNEGNSVDCTAKRIFGKHPLFNSLQMDNVFQRNNLIHDLSNYWPDLTTSGYNNYCFWAREYNKHGSCTFRYPLDYFELTLSSGKHFSTQLSGLIKNRRLKRGYSYPLSTIEFLVENVISTRPSLKCTEVRGKSSLLEIRICVRRNHNGLYPVPCINHHSDCGNPVVFP